MESDASEGRWDLLANMGMEAFALWPGLSSLVPAACDLGPWQWGQ